VSQLALLNVPAPALPTSVDLRCCTVQDLIASYEADPPALIIADPPWCYQQAPGHSANPDNHYGTMPEREIASILDGAFDLMDKGRLALWITWPFVGLFMDATKAGQWRWRYVSGGCWTKQAGRAGTGYHWLGACEPVLLYVKGTGLCTEWGALQNAHTSPRMAHSEKPWQWMAGWIERWTDPGDLVVDLFAGMAPVALACVATGRRYIGAEADPVRHRQALDRIALGVGQL